MNEQELGKILLQAGAAEGAGSLDARRLAAMVLERDRRRIRLLGGVILALWLVGAAGIAFVLYELAVHVPEYMAMMMEIEQGNVDPMRRQRFQEGYFGGFQIGMIITASSVAILALAALGTFLLVLTTRRATLRQVNSSLMLIAERLAQLQRAREGTGAAYQPSTSEGEDRPIEP
jgi:hypothetical protein